ncbi:hypothetical protein AMJ85_09770 [candidate division BRC1 bacterium SM23_51]|nr:MAG: hypothetical protein AMJ85_09770 [candidate division BRC1 bacterium SM23_51]
MTHEELHTDYRGCILAFMIQFVFHTRKILFSCEDFIPPTPRKARKPKNWTRISRITPITVVWIQSNE